MWYPIHRETCRASTEPKELQITQADRTETCVPRRAISQGRVWRSVRRGSPHPTHREPARPSVDWVIVRRTVVALKVELGPSGIQFDGKIMSGLSMSLPALFVVRIGAIKYLAIGRSDCAKALWMRRFEMKTVTGLKIWTRLLIGPHFQTPASCVKYDWLLRMGIWIQTDTITHCIYYLCVCHSNEFVHNALHSTSILSSPKEASAFPVYHCFYQIHNCISSNILSKHLGL